jgi:hypothetical protein
MRSSVRRRAGSSISREQKRRMEDDQMLIR